VASDSIIWSKKSKLTPARMAQHAKAKMPDPLLAIRWNKLAQGLSEPVRD
jgi:hypothetical protein